MSSHDEFDGLVAVVTGGASGIGKAIADTLAAAGARVAVLDRDPGDAPPSGGINLYCDVVDDASVRDAVARVHETFGRLDIVVNNAGIGAQGTIEDNSDDEWRNLFEVNVFGAVRVSRAALPHLRRSPSGARGGTRGRAGPPRRPNPGARRGRPGGAGGGPPACPRAPRRRPRATGADGGAPRGKR
ncbi:SDR family NAD(P)-dependent oxidoreductase, partial [Nocardia brasiliensis]|uniref:SDR family NAD(P)-dependent oxidoreductase n=1 Tax=Nocardia brasiliensis TaxID=37326 RepID=UPI0024559073